MSTPRYTTMSAVEHTDMLLVAIQKYQREKVAKKIRKRKENGWEEVHREMKTVEESCELSESIQNLPPEVREIILKEYLAIKMREKKENGWEEVHEELQELPLCERQGQITKVFNCRICNPCGRVGLCIACFLNQAENHYLVAHEEITELAEKGFVRWWGRPKRISMSKQEKKKREELLRMLNSKHFEMAKKRWAEVYRDLESVPKDLLSSV